MHENHLSVGLRFWIGGNEVSKLGAKECGEDVEPPDRAIDY